MYKDLLKSEQKNWNEISGRYKAMAERIKKKIEELHKRYTLSSESPRVSGKKYKHFPSLRTNGSEVIRVIKCYFTGYGGNFN